MKKIQTAINQFFNTKSQFQHYIGRLLLISLFVFASLVVTTVSYASLIDENNPIQNSSISGEWFIDFNRPQPDKVQLTLIRKTVQSGYQVSGHGILFSELQGLTREQSFGASKDVKFRIVREAGTFECEGTFRNGKGVGFWTLTPSQSFISSMDSRGYDNLTENNLFSSALHNLTTRFLDDLKTAGYERITFEEIRRALTHNVTLQFIREMKSAGYENLTMEELVRARNHGVNDEYVKHVKAMGFERESLEGLIRLRNHSITAEFINQMRSVGFQSLSIEQLIRLRNHSITPEFISDLKAEGYYDVVPETVIRLKNHQIDRDFIRRAKSQGYGNIALEELVRLRNRGTIK